MAKPGLKLVSDPKRDALEEEIRRSIANLMSGSEQLYALDGNPRGLLFGIAYCLLWGVPAPISAGKEFAKLFFSARGSYDKVFGRPPTDKEFDRSVRNTKYGDIIGARIAASKGVVPIDENLFEQIGEEMGIGKTLVKTLYRRHLGRPRRKPKPKRSSGQGRKF